jgi:sulfate adenylyltransferase
LQIFLKKIRAHPIPSHSAVFGANDQAHPAVWYLFNKAGDYYVGGSIEGIQLPPHYDFVELRRTFTPLDWILHSNG